MGDIHDLGEAFSWSVSKLADCFGVHRQTMTKKLKEAGVKPTGEHRGNPVYHIADVARLLYGPKTEGGPGLDLDQFPEARKAWYQSENERVKFQTSIRQLIPEHEYARELSLLAKTVAQYLDSLPDQLERDANLDAATLDLVQASLDSVREQMYQAVVAASAESGDATDG